MKSRRPRGRAARASRHEAQHGERLLGLRRQAGKDAVAHARLGKLGKQPGLPRLRLAGQGASPPLCPDVARHNACKRLGGARGVLAEIEAHGREAEELHGVAHRAHQIGGDRGELCFLQRVLQHAEIEDQLVGIGVIGPRLASAIALGAGDGGVELAQHDGEVLAIGLAGIARRDRARVAARLQLAGKLGAEAFRHRRARAR